MDTSNIRQSVNKKLGDFTAQTSSDFLSLSNSLKINDLPAAQKQTDHLFKKLLEFNRSISADINFITDEYEKLNKLTGTLKEEKRRLEVLYSSGIMFLSDTEMKNLMQKAIETVVNELKADQGFIVLTNENGEPTTFVSKNMDHISESTAKDLSLSVIKNAIDRLEPLNLNNLKQETEFAKQTSIISLGLTAVLCVPLISNSVVLGAVYIDRRNKESNFKDEDLVYLISFAKQIVKGIEVSQEISTLEERIEKEVKQSINQLRSEFKCDSIIGSSNKLLSSLRLASKVSNSDASLFILGENGTGKDLFARAIHDNSPRKDKPFVAVNCGAIPPDLLESELFGYESGAFTGANKNKPGKLEIADGGTVFLDEIAEMSINLQAKLLRIIQTKEIERLGSVTPRKIDIRFIAATNQNIAEYIKSNRFREDLYYRLKVIEIKLPSLRERKEDIEELVHFFIKKYSKDQEVIVSPEVLAELESYDWPGNIRELENVIHRSLILTQSNILRTEDLPPEIIAENEIDKYKSELKTLQEAESEFRRMFILKCLRKTESKSEAAKILGINRTHLYKLLEQLDIRE